MIGSAICPRAFLGQSGSAKMMRPSPTRSAAPSLKMARAVSGRWMRPAAMTGIAGSACLMAAANGAMKASRRSSTTYWGGES